MAKIKQYMIDKLNDKFHLTLKEGYRRIDLGIYDTEAEANNALLKAKTDFNSFMENFKGAGSGRTNTGSNYYQTPYKRYGAYIYFDRKKVHLGHWKTEEEAKKIVALAKTDLEEALILVERNSMNYFASREGKNYYQTDANTYEVLFKRHLGSRKKVKWYYLGTYKTEEEAQAIVEEFKKYEVQNQTLKGVEAHIKAYKKGANQIITPANENELVEVANKGNDSIESEAQNIENASPEENSFDPMAYAKKMIADDSDKDEKND